MSIKLNVPFEDKDIVKALGAKWDGNLKTWYIPNHICDLKPFEKYIYFTLSKANYIFNPKESYFILGYQNCYKYNHQNLFGVFASSDFKKHENNLVYTRYRNLTIFDSIRDFSYSDSDVLNWMCSLTNSFDEFLIPFQEYENFCEQCNDQMAEYELIADEFSVFHIHHLIDNLKSGYLAFNHCPVKFDFPLYCYPADDIINPSISLKATKYLKYLLNKK